MRYDIFNFEECLPLGKSIMIWELAFASTRESEGLIISGA